MGTGDSKSLSQSFGGRAIDDLRGMKFPLFGWLGIVFWEVVFACVSGAVGALAPENALWWQRGLWGFVLGLAGVIVGLVLLYMVMLPVAVWRQRAEARSAALEKRSDDVEVITSYPVVHKARESNSAIRILSGRTWHANHQPWR